MFNDVVGAGLLVCLCQEAVRNGTLFGGNRASADSPIRARMTGHSSAFYAVLCSCAAGWLVDCKVIRTMMASTDWRKYARQAATLLLIYRTPQCCLHDYASERILT